MGDAAEANAAERSIEMWKIKKVRPSSLPPSRGRALGVRVRACARMRRARRRQLRRAASSSRVSFARRLSVRSLAAAGAAHDCPPHVAEGCAQRACDAHTQRPAVIPPSDLRTDGAHARARAQLIRGLEAARGNGTSMISLIMHPRDQARRRAWRSLRCRAAASGVPPAGCTLTCGLTCSRVRHSRAQVSRVAKMLADEFGTASNIKNRVNRQVGGVV
jgi:hypothetical protein